MDTWIGDVESSVTVRGMDGDLNKADLVSIMLQAVRDEQEHDKRLHAERRITGGVAQELEEEVG
jgi:hypothetical protein